MKTSVLVYTTLNGQPVVQLIWWNWWTFSHPHLYLFSVNCSRHLFSVNSNPHFITTFLSSPRTRCRGLCRSNSFTIWDTLKSLLTLTLTLTTYHCWLFCIEVNSINNNNTNAHANVYGVILMTMVTARVHPVHYRQHCAQHNAPVLNLHRGWSWVFLPRRGDTLHRWGWNLASLLHDKFHPHRCNDKDIGPHNWNFYSDLINMWSINAPQGRIPCAIFTNFAGFVTSFRTR